MTDENRKFYEGIKIALTSSFKLSRANWLKYVYRKTYKDLQDGMRNWHQIGLKHMKKVVDSLKTAEETGNDLDEHIGILCFSSL